MYFTLPWLYDYTAKRLYVGEVDLHTVGLCDGDEGAVKHFLTGTLSVDGSVEFDGACALDPDS